MRVFAITLVVALASSAAQAAEDEPPEELYSPDRQYSVKILQSALPGSDPYDGFFTIAVRKGKQYSAKYPTMGYLIDAFWSPNGKYVAVDNRRANSGDYLWVFRLSDGRAIKMPGDAIPDQAKDAYGKYVEDLVGRVTRKFPEFTYGQFRKLFTFAKDWTRSGDLVVKTNFSFRNLPEKQVVFLLQTYKVVGDKLVLDHEEVAKGPWPPKA